MSDIKCCKICLHWQTVEGARVCTYMDGIDLPPWAIVSTKNNEDQTRPIDGRNCKVWELPF